jgi:DNA adenine methylase
MSDFFVFDTPTGEPVEKYRRPVLKWLGGKFKLLDRIFDALPQGSRLVEPFTGSGVLGINSPYGENLCGDINPDLINLHTAIRNRTEEFIEIAKPFFVPEKNTIEAYYPLREEFNRRDSDEMRMNAIFLYLNKHCFNGLCRYNRNGGFNASLGGYTTLVFPEPEVRNFAEKAQNITYRVGGFSETLSECQDSDVVYCDPPYIPASDTASFTKYSKSEFGMREQEELADWARKLAKRGIPVAISNSDNATTRALYRGAEFRNFDVLRSISTKRSTRGNAAEIIALFS